MCVVWTSQAARAETIGGALVKAYLNNPDINQQRAAVRVSDENISKAAASGLPSVSATASAGWSVTQASVVTADGLGDGGTTTTGSNSVLQPQT